MAPLLPLLKFANVHAMLTRMLLYLRMIIASQSLTVFRTSVGTVGDLGNQLDGRVVDELSNRGNIPRKNVLRERQL